jgi:hypothetical protein
VTAKLEFYDILGILVPGLLLLAWLPLCFPGVRDVAVSLSFPDAFSVMALTAIAILLGHVIQAVGSLFEPLYFRTWGGRPSDRALAEGLGRYLPLDSSQRIRTKLVHHLGEGATNHSLFLFAIQISEGESRGRAERFNGLYAYHRALLTLLILGLVLLLLAQFLRTSIISYPTQFAGVLVAALLVAALTWHRARQRAFYYIREVLLTSERVLDDMRNRQGESMNKGEEG